MKLKRIFALTLSMVMILSMFSFFTFSGSAMATLEDAEGRVKTYDNIERAITDAMNMKGSKLIIDNMYDGTIIVDHGDFVLKAGTTINCVEIKNGGKVKIIGGNFNKIICKNRTEGQESQITGGEVGCLEAYSISDYTDNRNLKSNMRVSGGKFKQIVYNPENSTQPLYIDGLLADGCAYKYNGKWINPQTTMGVNNADYTEVLEAPIVSFKASSTPKNVKYDNQLDFSIVDVTVGEDFDVDDVTFKWLDKSNNVYSNTEDNLIVRISKVQRQKYTCELSLDGYKLTHTWEFDVSRATPTIIVNSATPKYGTKLSEININDIVAETSVPGSCSWVENTNMTVGDVGERSFHIKFTPNDTTNYEPITQPVSFKVFPKDVTPTETPIEPQTYTGEEIEPEIELKDGDAVIPASEYKVEYSSNINVGRANISITDKENGNYTVADTNLQFSIEPAIPIKDPDNETTARVRKGSKLADADVNEGLFYGIDETAHINGTLSWIDDEIVVEEDGYQWMRFTPESTNYANLDFEVWVDAYSNSSGGGGSTTRYLVAFDTNGGTVIGSQRVKKGETAVKPEAPVKDGFDFGGWYSDIALTQEYDFSTKVTGAMTLYAKWVANGDDGSNNNNNNNNGGEKDNSDDDWDNPFLDVKEDDWFFDDVKYVYIDKIMTGTSHNLFEPNSFITRGMFVTALYRMEGNPQVLNKSIPFVDVSADKYYYDAVIWAQQNGIVKGISETEYAPEDNILREQIAAMMFRYARYKGYDISLGESTNILSYTDFDKISEYAIEPLQYAVGSGLIKGKSATELKPQDNATRAEIAAILKRFIEWNK